MDVYAENGTKENSPVIQADAVDALFTDLEKEINDNIPKGQETLSYSNNYQSMEPEPMTYYLGSGTAEVMNGLTVKTSGQTVAAWE